MNFGKTKKGQPAPTPQDGVPEHLAPFYDHPDDEDDLLARYTDRTAEADWHRETSFASERDRLVAAGELHPDLDWRQAKARIKATGYVVPPMTGEDRQAYRHHVRLAFAQRRYEDAERGRRLEEQLTRARTCVVRGHLAPATRTVMLRGQRVQLCDDCHREYVHQELEDAAQVDLDGEPRRAAVTTWRTGLPPEPVDPMTTVGPLIAYANGMAVPR